MKRIIVRVCAWLTMIIFSLTSLIGFIMLFIGEASWAAIITFFVCFLITVTGWYARKYGLSGFKTDRFSVLSAIVSLVVGGVFIVLMPIFFSHLSGFEDSYVAIRNLLILFSPVVISAIAILMSKTEYSAEAQGNRK
ncbi:hypothetical protein Q4E40_09875 [Pontibacter sp. BT731]|uniref:hypothetical protein n=1 Tax=Pontibacter coccineus TaxID=3063328 RepID=UPI0026E17D46|nr:hypothetical protein [Pontibacter sp. BT731]MDO6390433.1 hypothetical protein [Pontibacter sp. BT731]